MSDDPPDVILTGEPLHWRCRCGKFTLHITSTVAGMSMRHTCPHCGETGEWISAGEAPS